MGGHNDATAHRGKVVGVFIQSKNWQKKKTPRKFGRKFKTGLTQAKNALTLLTKKTRQTGDKRKEDLVFIHNGATTRHR